MTQDVDAILQLTPCRSPVSILKPKVIDAETRAIRNRTRESQELDEDLAPFSDEKPQQDEML